MYFLDTCYVNTASGALNKQQQQQYIRFHHCADDKDFITDAMKWTKNVWDKIEIGQEIRNSEYWIYFKLNGQITHERKNSKPKGNIFSSFIFSIYYFYIASRIYPQRF